MKADISNFTFLNYNWRVIHFLFLYFLAVSHGCKFTVQSKVNELTSISSPGYSNGAGTYTSNMDCSWLLDSGDDNVTLLIFITYSTVCPGDKISIYDGPDDTSSILANGLCGSVTEPDVYYTSQRNAFVTMVTDAVKEDAGFVLDFISASDYSGTGCDSPQTLTAETDFKMISSPGFPNIYPSYSDCRWTLNNPGGRIEVDVIISDIESDIPIRCDYDKLQFNNGNARCENNHIAMFCSEYPTSKPVNYTSTGSDVLVTFESDPSNDFRGFLLRYKSSEPLTSSSLSSTTTACSSNTAGQGALVMDAGVIAGIICGSVVLLSLAIVVVAYMIIKARPEIRKQNVPTPLFTPTLRQPSSNLRSRKINVQSARDTTLKAESQKL